LEIRPHLEAIKSDYPKEGHLIVSAVHFVDNHIINV